MLDWSAIAIAHGEHEAIVGEREVERVGAAVMAFESERVLLEQVEDRDLALVLDLGIVAADRGLDRA